MGHIKAIPFCEIQWLKQLMKIDVDASKKFEIEIISHLADELYTIWY